MQAVLRRPPGPGPFPLAVVNHGSDQDPVARDRMGLPSFPVLTNWLISKGYAVLLPLRPGHGATGGRYLEDQGSCARPDYTRSGLATAQAIESSIEFMRTDPTIRKDGVVIFGNSAGGWGAVALASRNPAGVRAVIAFAPGRGGRNRGRAGDNCAPDRLVEAAAAFGRSARIPSLWLYAENDSFFPPALSQRMADAYRSAGGRLDYRLLPAVGGEGHNLIQSPAERWAPAVESFLASAR